MDARFLAATGIAGLAALAAYIVASRRASRRRWIEVDDDRAAEIIRRFAPALTDAAALASSA